MAHGITDQDRLTYTAEVPWHGLGKNAGQAPVSIDEVADVFDWDVEKYAITSVTGDFAVDANEHFAIVRLDTRTVLGTCKGVYTVFDNRAALDYARELGLQVNVAGTLWGGERCFLDLDTAQHASVKRADGSWDPLTSHLLFSWHHGSGAIHLLPATFRTVCHNTLTGNLRAHGLLSGKAVEDHEKLVYSIRHTASLQSRLELAKVAIQSAIQGVADFALVAAELDRQRLSAFDLDEFLGALLYGESDDPAEALAEARVWSENASQASLKRAEATIGQIEGLFSQGIGNQGASKYDALNAVTEWIDHQRRRAKAGALSVSKLSSLTESAWYGDGAKVKRRALGLLTKGA